MEDILKFAKIVGALKRIKVKKSPENILKFANITGNLKKIKRTGWVREQIKEPESVADHIHRTAVLAMVLGERLGVDRDRLIKMALVHDLGESVIGDIVFERGHLFDPDIRKIKLEKEKGGMKKVLSYLKHGKEYYDLWLDYEEQSSKEAKVLKQLDRLEMAIQAFEYEVSDNRQLDEFLINAEKHVIHEELKKLLEHIKSKRQKHFKKQKKLNNNQKLNG